MKGIKLLFLFFLFLVFTLPTLATSETIISHNDAAVDVFNPTFAYGHLSFVFVNLENAISEKRTYIQFNTTNVSSSASISEALMCLNAYSNGMESGESYTAGVHSVFVDWVETSITWANQVCGVSFDNTTNCNISSSINTSVLTNNTLGWVCFDISSGIVRNNVTKLVLKVQDVVTDDDSVAFYSRNNAVLKPYLNITYVEPTPVDSHALAYSLNFVIPEFYCGDLICTSGLEDCSSCSFDCGVCPAGGGGGGVSIGDVEDEEDVNITGDLIGPDSIFWGIDIFGNDILGQGLHFGNEESVNYSFTIYKDRQIEFMKCVQDSNSECALYSIELLDMYTYKIIEEIEALTIFELFSFEQSLYSNYEQVLILSRDNLILRNKKTDLLLISKYLLMNEEYLRKVSSTLGMALTEAELCRLNNCYNNVISLMQDYDNDTISLIYKGAGFTAASIFWGVDTGLEYLWFSLKQQTSSQYLYYLKVNEEREKEFLKCLSKSRLECCEMSLQQLEYQVNETLKLRTILDYKNVQREDKEYSYRYLNYLSKSELILYEIDDIKLEALLNKNSELLKLLTS